MKNPAHGFTLISKACKGFTLIELLVVISIMVVTGVFALSNFGTFGEDQNLKNAVLDVVSLLRQAQSNASTNIICANGNWQVIFVSTSTIKLKCSTSANPQKTLQLDSADPNIAVSSVSVTSCMTAPPFTINFAPLTGNMDFVGFANCASLKITLLNSKTTNTKDMMMEKGGRIYAN